ncbi:MAG: DUF1592 domain-containing protein [Planctomycetota bacterium]
MPNTRFFMLVLLCLPLAEASLNASEVSRKAMMPSHRAELFQKHCYACHDSIAVEAGVDLDTIPFEISRDMETAGLWQKVLNAINSGEMPPEDFEPIPDSEKLAFLEDLTPRMVLARRILGEHRGPVPLRRLNRREYANAMGTLLGVRPDVSLLPNDQSGAGFDTHGASLFLSSDQIEQYLASARSALQTCFSAVDDVKPFHFRGEIEAQFEPKIRLYFDKLIEKKDRAQSFLSQDEKPASTFGLVDSYEAEGAVRLYESFAPILSWYFDQAENQHGGATIMVPKTMGMARYKLPKLSGHQPGRYTVRVRAAAYPEAEERYHYIEFSRISGANAREHLGWRKVTAALDHPQVVEFSFDHLPGEEARLEIHQRTHQDRADKVLWTTAQKENGFGLHPGLWLDWVEIELIEPSTTTLDAKEQILGLPNDTMSEPMRTADTLSRFAVRAFRGRSPSPDFLRTLNAIYWDHRDEGESVEQSLIESLAVILASPEFLYMINEGDEDHPDLLSGPELATRLAFMLWSQPADHELMALAIDGQLTSPEVLETQTARLLADDRSEQFLRDFTHQWLQLDRLGMFQFDGSQFPTFDNSVREYGREELFEMVGTVMHERLPLATLLKSDFVVVNDLLAAYYGIPDVDGPEFRKVKVSKNSVRGGLLGTAAVCAMGSDGLKTSPVERGVWVLKHLLNDPPAPAPPNVPQLSRLEGELVSNRDIQALHQEQPQCAQCHRKIDPIGFGLENFSAVGLWRDVDVVRVGDKRRSTSESFDIDPSGTLPTGEAFSGFIEMRDLIATKHDDFARGFVDELISYGLGRPVGFSDEMLAEEILNATRDDGYVIKDMIHAFIQSNTFRSK